MSPAADGRPEALERDRQTEAPVGESLRRGLDPGAGLGEADRRDRRRDDLSGRTVAWLEVRLDLPIGGAVGGPLDVDRLGLRAQEVELVLGKDVALKDEQRGRAAADGGLGLACELEVGAFDQVRLELGDVGFDGIRAGNAVDAQIGFLADLGPDDVERAQVLVICMCVQVCGGECEAEGLVAILRVGGACPRRYARNRKSSERAADQRLFAVEHSHDLCPPC